METIETSQQDALKSNRKVDKLSPTANFRRRHEQKGNSGEILMTTQQYFRDESAVTLYYKKRLSEKLRCATKYSSIFLFDNFARSQMTKWRHFYSKSK